MDAMIRMRRRDIRELKRAISDQSDGAAMCALLQRSVRFGHKRLALLRCIQAEQMGVHIAPELLAYCSGIANDMAPEELHKIVERAGRQLSLDRARVLKAVNKQ